MQSGKRASKVKGVREKISVVFVIPRNQSCFTAKTYE
jgi:hypothetical protein